MAGTLFVDATATALPHDGSSWANAYLDLDAALANAGLNDDILLAEGTYTPKYTPGASVPTPGARTNTFDILVAVNIYGGYIGFNGGSPGSPTPDAPDGNRFATNLSGDLLGTPFDPGDDAYHVVTLSYLSILQKVRLDGLRISSGYADSTAPSPRGGGIAVYGSWLILSDAFLEGNFADTSGGGIYIEGDSKLDIKKTRIRRNHTNGDGGAIKIEGHTAARLFNLHMSQNSAKGMGGALRFESSTDDGSLELVNSILFDNQADQGGAISMEADSEGRQIINCTIAFNTGNAVVASGAGIHVDKHNHTVNLLNSIVKFNPDPADNDNVWTATPSKFYVHHTNLGTSVAGLNMTAATFNLNPKFVNDIARNLKLKSNSPCLETGNDGLLPADVLDIDEDGSVTERLDRDIRVQSMGAPSDREKVTGAPSGPIAGVDLPPSPMIVDMGAYEHYYPSQTGGGGV